MKPTSRSEGIDNQAAQFLVSKKKLAERFSRIIASVEVSDEYKVLQNSGSFLR